MISCIVSAVCGCEYNENIARSIQRISEMEMRKEVQIDF